MADKAKKKKPTNMIDVGTSLTIEQVKQVQKQFNTKTAKKKEVTLHSKLLETIDLAGIQLLIHLKSKAEKEGKKVNVDIKASEAVNDLAEKSGFVKLFES